MNRLRIPLMQVMLVAVMFAAVESLSPQLIATAQQPPAQNAHKVAILVLNYPALQGGGSAENMIKAISYALQLKRAGAEVVMLLDGPGLQWMSFFSTGEFEADKLQEEPWNPSEERKSKLGAMLVNSMNSVDIAPDEKAKLSRMLLESVFSPKRQTRSSAEKTRLLDLRKKLREADIPMMLAEGEKTAQPQKMKKKVKSNKQGRLDIAAYVLDGYQVWVF
ncbi:MAG: hypothetical protein ABIG11_05725 [bacterium]